MSDLHLNAHSIDALHGFVTVMENGKNAFGRRAFAHGSEVTWSFHLPATLGAVGGSLFFSADEEKDILSVPLVWDSLQDGYDVYQVVLQTDRLPVGLYFCRLLLQSACGPISTWGGNTVHFYPGDNRDAYLFQMTLSAFAYQEPSWIHGGVIYHIFVDRFFRGGNAPVREDAILNPDWENGIPQYAAYPGAPLANNMFFGGDLWGVKEKLPYIASLGVKCIYLSPIFRAYSNHKYDTGDYSQVDEMFGGQAALDALIAAAAAYDIRIILDGVFNHTGADSLYFNRFGTYSTLGAYQSQQSPYYDWYHFTAFPDEYEAWWGIQNVPRINTAVPSCFDYFMNKQNGIIARYARQGIGGMRLDVADELSEHFLEGVKENLSEHIPDAILYGEVWEDASNKIAYGKRRHYYLGKQLDGVMNYPARNAVIHLVRDHDMRAMAYYFGEVLPNMPKRAADVAMNLLGTHDTERILTALGGESPEGKSNEQLSTLRMNAAKRKKALDMLMAAYTVIATLPGIPAIYYGDEVGMEGYADPFNRMPYPWHDQETSLLAHYRLLAKIRQEQSCYKKGECRLLTLTPDLLAFTREEEDVCLTLFYNGKEPMLWSLPSGAVVLTKQKVKNGEITLKAPDAAVIRLPQNACIAF